MKRFLIEFKHDVIMRMIFGVCLTAISLLTACEKSGMDVLQLEEPYTLGQEGYYCEGNDDCNEGLVCASGVCVDLSTIESDSSSDSADNVSDDSDSEVLSSDGDPNASDSMDPKSQSEDTASEDADDTPDSESSGEVGQEIGEYDTDGYDSESESQETSTDDTETIDVSDDTGEPASDTEDPVSASDTEDPASDTGTDTDDSASDTEEPASDTMTETGDSQDLSDTDEFDTDNICERIEVEVGIIPNRVVIVQDLSSSLHSSGRWNPIKAAMVQLVEQYDSNLALGAVPFPTTLLDGTTSDADCTVNEQYIISPAVGSGEQINNLIYSIQSEDLIGGTPTYEGLMQARSMLVDDDPNDGSGRYIILVTDGLPNCYDDNGAGLPEQQDIDRVTETIEAIHADDIAIFVVGYDMGASDLETLNQWAILGGTQSAYAVDDTTSLLEQMSAISGGLISCSYTLDQPVADPKFVRVQIDEESIPLNDSNGWSLSGDGSTISLEGESCNQLQNGDMHTVDVAVECKIVII